MPHVLKVRIVCPLEQRVERATRYLDIPKAEARKQIKQDDAARNAFVRSHFDEDLADPLAYDITLNTGSMEINAAARLLLEALRSH